MLLQTSAFKQANTFIRVGQRAFAGKGGPPGQEPTKIPDKRGKSLIEKMIDDGADFPLGAPPNPKKTWGASRDTMLNKLEPHLDIYARKLREMYIREGTIPQVKSFLNPIRERQPTDTLEYCTKENTMPGVIHGRDEFSDVDLVWPWRTPFRVTKSEHAYVRPWYVIHPRTEEEIRVTCKQIDKNVKTQEPQFIEFQRYIVGRPNLINIPVVPAQEDKSLHFIAGANVEYHIKNLWVWCFSDIYPGRIDLDCSSLSTNMSIKIGDVEKMLPYGMYLHKMYNHQKFHSVVSFSITNKYIGRRNLIIEQTDQIKQQRRKMQSQMLEKKRERKASTATKSVPMYIQSSKEIAASKKNVIVRDEFGEEVTLTTLMERSKEGGAGKGGRGVR